MHKAGEDSHADCPGLSESCSHSWFCVSWGWSTWKGGPGRQPCHLSPPYWPEAHSAPSVSQRTEFVTTWFVHHLHQIICDTSYNVDSWVPPHTDCIKLSVNVSFCFAFCVPFPRSPKDCLGSSFSLPFISPHLPWIMLNIMKLPRSCHVWVVKMTI